MRKFHFSENLKTFGITISNFAYCVFNSFLKHTEVKNNPQ